MNVDALAQLLAQFDDGLVAEAVERRFAGGSSAPATSLTVAELVEEALPLLGGLTEGTVRAWEPKLRVLADSQFGHLAVADITADELRVVAREVKERAAAHPQGRTGKGAREHFVNAARWLFRYAVSKGYRTTNPALAVKHLSRDEPERRGLSADEFIDMVNVARVWTDDPELYGLAIHTVAETTCRKGALIGVELRDLLDDAIRFRDKGDKTYLAPASQRLLAALRRLARSRGATRPTDRVFRTKNGADLNRRSFEPLYRAFHEHCDWIRDDEEIGLHNIRHTTTRVVERCFGEAVANAYCHHAPSSRGVTGTYTKATDEEVRQAHQFLFEPEALDIDRNTRKRELVADLVGAANVGATRQAFSSLTGG